MSFVASRGIAKLLSVSDVLGVVAAPSVESTVPIDVDSSDAPFFLRFTISGEWPSLHDQRSVRDQLVSSGQLISASRVLVDVRGVVSASEPPSFVGLKDGPVARVQAYLVSSSIQHQLARRFKQATKSAMVEIFVDEKHALEWLWNADPDY